MSYEMYRNEVFTEAMESMEPSLLDRFMTFMDKVAEKFNFEKKCTDIIHAGGIPEDIVKAYIATKAVAHISMGTIKNYYSVITNMFKAVQMPIDKITATTIRVYLNNLQHGDKHNLPSTAENKRIVIRDFFQWCVDEDILTKNPCRNVDPIKFSDNIREPLDNIELAKMRFACQDSRERLLVEFLYSTGCRIAEVINMKIKDIDLEKHTAIVQHGKGDKRRYVYLSAEAIIAIKMYLKTRKDNCEYLFVNKRTSEKHKLTNKALQDEIIKIRERTDIDNKKITPHNFRHTTATRCSESGMPIEEIRQMLGHASIKTTQRYIQVNDENVRNHHWNCL